MTWVQQLAHVCDGAKPLLGHNDLILTRPLFTPSGLICNTQGGGGNSLSLEFILVNEHAVNIYALGTSTKHP